jgi:predicted nucleotidyltransferase
MPATLDEEARIAAVDFARDMAEFCRAQFGPQLLGAYLLGSLAHGGFSRRYSDIDMLLVADDGFEPAALAALRAEAAARDTVRGPKLSLFWTDRHCAIGRFPPLDRADYLDHAVTLAEREHVVPKRPTLDEVRDYLGAAPLANWADSVQRFVVMDALAAKDHKSYIRALLYPARLIYGWTTGRMGSNDDAVAFTCGQRAPGLDVDLIARALAYRSAAADPDDLFPARFGLPQQVEACVRVLKGG